MACSGNGPFLERRHLEKAECRDLLNLVKKAGDAGPPLSSSAYIQ